MGRNDIFLRPDSTPSADSCVACQQIQLGDLMSNKIQCDLAAIAFRSCVAAVLAVSAFAPSAQAQPAKAAALTSISGVYNGTYAGDQGSIKFKLSITQQDNGIIAGTFTLYLPEGSDTKEYTAAVSGRYIEAKQMVQVFRGKWETP